MNENTGIGRRQLLGYAAALVGGLATSPHLPGAAVFGTEQEPTPARYPDRQVGVSPAVVANPTLIAADTITAPPFLFGRVRAINDDTRLHLTRNGAGPVTITGARAAAPAYYGIDFSICVSNNAAGLSGLYSVFDNTLLGTLDYYLAPTVGGVRVNDSWMRVGAGELLDQGWALVPIYVGLQQYSGHGDDQHGQHPSWFAHQVSAQLAVARAQGRRDGQDAVTLAGRAQLPRGSRIFLDIETVGFPAPAQPLGPAMVAYIAMWSQQVQAGHYQPACYGLSRVCDQLHQGNPALPIYASRGYYSVPINDGAEPHATHGQEITLDTRAVPMAPPSANAAGFGFTHYAAGWQWCLDWPGRTADLNHQPALHRLPAYLDTGVRNAA